MKKGFSLIETLMTIALMGIIIGTGTVLFFSIIRSSTKARALAEVKQNGNYVMNLMDRQIRNARSVESAAGNELQVNFFGGEETTFECNTTDGRIWQDGSTLTAPNVLVLNCSGFFSLVGTDPTVVVINFTLVQNTISNRPEDQARVTFSKSVTLRNYN